MPASFGLLASVALCLFVCESCRRLSSRTPRTPRPAVWWWVAGLIVSYAAILALIFFAARHQFPAEAWRSALMPLAVVDDRASAGQVPGVTLVAAAMLYLAAFQSYALLALYRQEPARTAVGIGCGIMLLLSCAAPALTSFDLYLYVRDALLGFAAYRPPNVPFLGAYHVFDLWLGTPRPMLYGPLWPIVAGLVTSLAPTLFAKLMTLRALGLLSFLAVLAGLRAFGVPSRILNVFALNPGLMLQYVANGHNDLIAIAALVWAAAVVRKRASLAFGLIAIAGLFKAPFVLLGLPIVAAVRSVRLRVAGSIAAFVAVAAISWLGAGNGYFKTLAEYGAKNVAPFVGQISGFIAVALIVLAAAGGRRLRSGVWIVPALGAILFPWYFVWGLPYALARRRVLGYLLVCFPFAAMLAGPFVLPWAVVLVAVWVVGLSLREPGAALDAARAGRV